MPQGNRMTAIPPLPRSGGGWGEGRVRSMDPHPYLPPLRGRGGMAVTGLPWGMPSTGLRGPALRVSGGRINRARIG
jgi:hypothetical protein